MEKSFLRKLFFYKLSVDELMTLNQEARVLYGKIDEMLKLLKDFMPKEKHEVLDKLTNYYDEVVCEDNERWFESGFYMGLRLGCESCNIE